ncbi:hypothetical protein C0995_008586 [Termitomyces sp. Mi166|nr:hypothetical protein C0995_008586 [Termitomyces sp. Mi166\
MQFKSLFLLVSLAVPSLAQTTVAQIENDIKINIGSSLTNFSTTIQAFSIWGGTFNQAMAIHYSALNFSYAISNTTADMNNITSQFSYDDCLNIISNLEILEPTFLQSLADMVARRPALEALRLRGIPAIVKQDIATMKTSADTFMRAFTTHAPSSIDKAVATMKYTVDTVFAKVMVAYNM